MNVKPDRRPRLKLLPLKEYRGVNPADPLRFYYWPILGRLYRRRVEMCLALCQGGRRILEVGYGSGLSFLNLGQWYEEIHGIDLTARASEVTAVFRAHAVNLSLLQGSVLNLPYETGAFDTVLLISILEHLQPFQQSPALMEIERVLKPGGAVIIGIPIERRLMRALFRLMGIDIRQHHFSTEVDVLTCARQQLGEGQVQSLSALGLGALYCVGRFTKSGGSAAPCGESGPGPGPSRLVD